MCGTSSSPLPDHQTPQGTVGRLIMTAVWRFSSPATALNPGRCVFLLALPLFLPYPPQTPCKTCSLPHHLAYWSQAAPILTAQPEWKVLVGVDLCLQCDFSQHGCPFALVAAVSAPGKHHTPHSCLVMFCGCGAYLPAWHAPSGDIKCTHAGSSTTRSKWLPARLITQSHNHSFCLRAVSVAQRCRRPISWICC